jgi:HK97 family phage major capsid protein
MSKRLEALRDKLVELESRQSAERTELVQLTEADDLDTTQEARYQELDSRFDGAGTWADQKEADETRSQIVKLEAIVSAPTTAREVAPSPTFLRRMPDPLADENVQYGPTEQVRAAAHTAIENVQRSDDAVKEQMTRTLDRADDPTGKLSRHMIAASRDSYRSAFSKLISNRSWALTPEEIRAVEHVRAASLTDASGGYAVPTVLDPTIILTGTHNGMSANPIRQLANVVQITGDNYNVVLSAGITAAWAAEAAEATDAAPTLSTLLITPYKAHAAVPFSVEIQGDWSQMESELRRLLLIAKDDLEIAAFTTGTGTTRPLGLFYDLYTNYTGQIQTSATTDTFAKADVYATLRKVATRYQDRGQWLANELIYDKVRQFDTGGGADMWVRIDAARPGVLIGRPAYSCAEIDGTYGSGENYVLMYGDVNAAYTIVDRVGMSIELVPHLTGTGNNLPNGQRALYAWWRVGGRVVDSGAVAVLNVT